MNPRKRRQRPVTVFDGRTHHVALCRGFRDTLPVFGWGEAPSTLLTRAQLREAGLRPNGHGPLALLVFRHHKPMARETVAELFSVELAAPQRGTIIQRYAKVEQALRARRVCVECRRDVGYYVPTSTRTCWDCEGIEAFGEGVAA
ncbi:ferrochelatase (EC 4.99.1.1) [Prauserella aidingensis]|uniref:RRQRL motif-containing zinc-binding protein n=1 Tax=Prauserella aidingensis TaxID=387890 RepID=UPI0020A35179|nr:RRQRL motif-containing zinc-binding protein [Prauserella aidingensis]MCP2255225.1 ferrochelatase (EC 4.99.1.1) [Prauserella aidingensis]